MSNLASIYADRGRRTEAEELNTKLIEIRKRILGQEHPVTLTSMTNFARSDWSQGRLKETEELQMQVVEIEGRTLGRENLFTLRIMSSLAMIWKKQGHNNKVLELMAEVVELSNRKLDLSHPDRKIYIRRFDKWQAERAAKTKKQEMEEAGEAVEMEAAEELPTENLRVEV
jgi:Tetratricopeptide repeat